MNSELAPIGLSTYSRLEHLTKTVEALKRNTLASQSELYVFSDAPRPGDEEAVAKVRSFIKNIDGFKNITILERKTNDRVFNNRGGIRSLLEKYGKCIFLEEDIITAPGFLQFINDGLAIYKKREDIFAICGYTPPVQLEKCYKNDIYLSPRFSAWGFGTWKDRFDRIVMDRYEFKCFLMDKKQVKKYAKNGEDLPRMLTREANGLIDALDAKILYTQSKYGLFTIAPTMSLTNNIGHDGTGIHCGTTRMFDTMLSNNYTKLNFDNNIKPNKKIRKQLYYFRSGLALNFHERIRQKIRAKTQSISKKIKVNTLISFPLRVLRYFKFYLLGSNKKRLIFCINSGRSGSNYLADLLGTATEVTSYHEADPPMIGEYLSMVNNASYEKSFQQRSIKSRAIKNILRKIPTNGIYCETNHMFIKTFFDVTLKDFKNVEVIILRRELASVLKSFIELNYFSRQNEVWPDWMSLPDAKTAAIHSLAIYREMDHYDRCIAYLIDIEARAQRFKKDYSSVKTHEIRLESLNNYNKVLNLFRDLRITPTDLTKEIIGQVVNDRSQRKRQFNSETDVEYCRERIALYFEKAEAMGISIPGTLALDRQTD